MSNLLKPMSKDDTAFVLDIMQEAFPSDELRTIEKQKEKFKAAECKSVIHHIDNKPAALIVYWLLGEFYYLEYLAVGKAGRNLGLGQKIMKEFLKSLDKPLVLEVEPADNEMSIRRIGFYERLGCKLNNHIHIQPSLNKGVTPAIRLEIMSYPKKISSDEYEAFRCQVYEKVYDTPREAVLFDGML